MIPTGQYINLPGLASPLPVYGPSPSLPPMEATSPKCTIGDKEDDIEDLIALDGGQLTDVIRTHDASNVYKEIAIDVSSDRKEAVSDYTILKDSCSGNVKPSSSSAASLTVGTKRHRDVEPRCNSPKDGPTSKRRCPSTRLSHNILFPHELFPNAAIRLSVYKTWVKLIHAINTVTSNDGGNEDVIAGRCLFNCGRSAEGGSLAVISYFGQLVEGACDTQSTTDMVVSLCCDQCVDEHDSRVELVNVLCLATGLRLLKQLLVDSQESVAEARTQLRKQEQAHACLKEGFETLLDQKMIVEGAEDYGSGQFLSFVLACINV